MPPRQRRSSRVLRKCSLLKLSLCCLAAAGQPRRRLQQLEAPWSCCAPWSRRRGCRRWRGPGAPAARRPGASSGLRPRRVQSLGSDSHLNKKLRRPDVSTAFASSLPSSSRPEFCSGGLEHLSYFETLQTENGVLGWSGLNFLSGHPQLQSSDGF